MELKSVREKAEEWGITPRRVQILCGEGRVEGAVRVGRAWVIPDKRIPIIILFLNDLPMDTSLQFSLPIKPTSYAPAKK